MPDVFVPQDTIAYNAYYVAVMNRSLVNKYSLKYVDSHRAEMSDLKDWRSVVDYVDRNGLYEDFISYAAAEGVSRPASLPASIVEQLKRLVRSGIMYDLLDIEEYTAYINTLDNTVLKAVEILKEQN